MSGLFEQPPRAVRPLSRMYDIPAQRASKGDMPTWATIRVQATPPCDECFANQHETGGASGPRAIARERRSFKGGPSLNLCRVHAENWRARDERDSK